MTVGCRKSYPFCICGRIFIICIASCWLACCCRNCLFTEVIDRLAVCKKFICCCETGCDCTICCRDFCGDGNYRSHSCEL